VGSQNETPGKPSSLKRYHLRASFSRSGYWVSQTQDPGDAGMAMVRCVLDHRGPARRFVVMGRASLAHSPASPLFTETGTCVRSSGEKSPQRCSLRIARSA